MRKKSQRPHPVGNILFYLCSVERAEALFLYFSGLVQTVPPFSRPLLLNIAKEMLVKKGQKDDETIHSFFSRRLGEEVHLSVVFSNASV